MGQAEPLPLVPLSRPSALRLDPRLFPFELAYWRYASQRMRAHVLQTASMSDPVALRSSNDE